MRIVRIDDLSEEERKKALERQEQRYQENEIARKNEINRVNRAFDGNNEVLPVAKNGYIDSKRKENNIWSDLKGIASNFTRSLGNLSINAYENVNRINGEYINNRNKLIEDTNNKYLMKSLQDKGYSDEQIQRMTKNAPTLESIANNSKVLKNITNNTNKVIQPMENKFQEWENINNEKIQENIDNASNSISKTILEITPSIAQSSVNLIPGGNVLFSAGITQNYYEQAKNEKGMSDDEASKYASIMATLESATEMIGAKLTKNVGKSLIKGNIKSAFANYGLDIGENFLEEAIMEPLGEVTAQITAGKEKADWKDIWQRSLKAGIDGALTSALMGGASAVVGKSANLINKANNSNTYKDYNSNEVLDKHTQNILNKAEDIIKKNDIDNLSQNQVNNIHNIQTQQTIQDENKMPQNQTSTELNDMLNNKELPMQSYQYEKSNNVKINNLRQDANRYFNNSEKARNYVSMLEKIITDKDIEIRLDANLKTTDGRIANGSYSNGVITINPNSTKTGEFIAIHELTHAIGTKEMLNMVNTYRKSNIEFDTDMKSLLQNYNETEISKEALSDVAGQLFGNQEFINNIAQENPNIFQKLYSEIKYLWHQFRGYKNQNQFVEDLYFKWTQAYNSNNKLNETSNYSIAGTKGMNNAIKQDTSNLIIEQSYNKALQMAKNNIDNEVIRQNTGWFQDRNGDWKFEFSDKNMSLKSNIKLEKNKTYKLNQILEHDILFQAYPELANYNVKIFSSADANGSFNKSNKTINISDRLINNSRLIEGTLIHEIQHAIQNIEGFERGKNSNKSRLAYYNSLGEIEASNTKDRFIKEKYNNKNMTNIAPESSKTNPKHKNLDNYLKNRNLLDKVKDSVYNYFNNKNGGNNNEINQEIVLGNTEQDSSLVDERGYRGYVTENSNKSSFSMQEDENNSWQQYLDKNFKPTGTRTNMQDILVQKANNEGSFSKTNDNVANSQEHIKQNIINEKVIEYANKNKNKFNTDINIDTKILNDANSLESNYKNMKETVLYNKARRLFSNIQKRVFRNNNQDIYVTNADIKESIDKTIKNPDQSKYMKENIAVFSQLDKIIENAELISSEVIDNKKRDKYQNYEYYVSKVNIDAKPYIVEFDTRLQEGTSGKKERHFRLERLYNINEVTSASDTDNSMNRFGTDVTSVNNSIPQNNSNMQVRQKNKMLNPTEVSNLTMEDAMTTPKLKSRNYAKGNKESSFLSNITTESGFLNEDLRKQMSTEENIRYYKGITNEQTLEKAYNSLQENGQQEVNKWYSKESKSANAEDVAKGWILLKQYQDIGDYESAVEVAKKMRDIGTTAGQTVQAYNVLSRLTPEGMFYYAQSELTEAYNKLVEGKSRNWIDKNAKDFNLTPEDTEFIIETMKKVATMEDGYNKKLELAKIQKLITDKLPSNFGQKVKTWMRISMLFNPKTQVRNILGNTVIMPVNMFSDTVSAGIDKLIAKKTGVRTTGITKKGTKGYIKGFGKGIYESYSDFKNGVNTRNIEGNRFEIGEGKSFSNKNIIGRNLNRVDNLLSFALDVGDRGFYEATFTNSINNQLVLNNTTEVTQDMIDIATTEALQRTWQDNNAYTQAVLSIRNALNGKVGKKKGLSYGLGDILIPFAKTPANLTKAIIDYSPVGLVNTLVSGVKLKNSLQTGQYTSQLQHKFVQNLGKATAGSFLYVLGYALAKLGITSGEADDDKDVKNFMKNSLGISSYSIKIGDKTFTYDWAQPVSAPISIMTNIVNSENKGKALLEGIVGNMDTAGSILLEQSFLQSINEVLNDNDGIVSGVINQVLNLPSRAIPTFSKQIADMVDGTQRTTFEYGKPIESSVNSLKAKIPGLSKTLPASVDTLGNEIQKYGGDNGLWNVMLNPSNVNKGKLSEVGQEIYNVYKDVGDKTIFPRTAPYYIDNKGEKITMNAEQRSKFQTISGKYVENSLSALMKDSAYKKLSNEQKSNIINEIVSDSYSKAKYDVLKIDSKEYKKKRETLNIVSAKSYYNYKFKTEGMKKDKDKINVIVNSSYSNIEKQVLYENYILSDADKKYAIVKDLFKNKPDGLNINKYLKYKLADSNEEFKADRKDDGTEDGKAITGSGKVERFDYINSIEGASYTQKLILYALDCKPSTRYQKDLVVNYITTNYKGNRQKEVLKIFGAEIYKDGTFNY